MQGIGIVGVFVHCHLGKSFHAKQTEARHHLLYTPRKLLVTVRLRSASRDIRHRLGRRGHDTFSRVHAQLLYRHLHLVVCEILSALISGLLSGDQATSLLNTVRHGSEERAEHRLPSLLCALPLRTWAWERSF